MNVTFGNDRAAHRSHALGRTNFAADYAPLPGNLTVRQNLTIFGLLYGMRDVGRRIEELIDRFVPDGTGLDLGCRWRGVRHSLTYEMTAPGG